MADWDADGPQLRKSLESVLASIEVWSYRRDPITAGTVKRWHRRTMAGLDAPHPRFMGRFRGEAGLEKQQIFVGARAGTAAALVAKEVAAFIQQLQRGFAGLDALLPSSRELDRDGLQAVITLAAWVHSEWVRIHPFVNGNGRTARMLANAVLMRYGLPPVLQLRPRPAAPHGIAGAAGMDKDKDAQPMERLLLGLLLAYPA